VFWGIFCALVFKTSIDYRVNFIVDFIACQSEATFLPEFGQSDSEGEFRNAIYRA
jgi:hypothetical protein